MQNPFPCAAACPQPLSGSPRHTPHPSYISPQTLNLFHYNSNSLPFTKWFSTKICPSRPSLFSPNGDWTWVQHIDLNFSNKCIDLTPCQLGLLRSKRKPPVNAGAFLSVLTLLTKIEFTKETQKKKKGKKKSPQKVPPKKLSG